MTDAGYGGYGPPNTLTVGSCKSVSVAGAKAVVAAWPGRVREIGCYRPCTTDWSSDHCYGKAIDLMCSDAGGVSIVAMTKESHLLTYHSLELFLEIILLSGS